MPATKKQSVVKEKKTSTKAVVSTRGKKEAVLKERKEKKIVKVEVKEKISVFDTEGNVISTLSAPKELFDLPFNAQLVAQAIRVYLANQRGGGASTKTRGEVEGSTRKIYRQKGTGRARHGSIRAPLFVGGGVVFGPRPRDFSLKFPKLMKRKALLTGLSHKKQSGSIKVIEGFDGLDLKTKLFVQAMDKIGIEGKVLLVTGEKTNGIVRAVRNIDFIKTYPVTSLTTYDVMMRKTIIFTKDAMDTFIKINS